MAFNPQTNTGIASKTGISLEPMAGVACKARRMFDRVSGNLAMDLTTIERRTIRNVTAPIGAVPGLADTSGNFAVEPTPEGISEWLCAAFGLPVSTPRVAPTTPTGFAGTYFGT